MHIATKPQTDSVTEGRSQLGVDRESRRSSTFDLDERIVDIDTHDETVGDSVVIIGKEGVFVGEVGEKGGIGKEEGVWVYEYDDRSGLLF